MKRAKTGRKIENKNNFLPTRSNPTRVAKFKNKCKKILKIKRHYPGIISRRNGRRQAKKIENKNNFLPIRSNPTRVAKIKNKCKKIVKIKNIIQATFQDEKGQDRPKNREQN